MGPDSFLHPGINQNAFTEVPGTTHTPVVVQEKEYLVSQFLPAVDPTLRHCSKWDIAFDLHRCWMKPTVINIQHLRFNQGTFL